MNRERKRKKSTVLRCATDLKKYVWEYCEMSSIQGIPQVAKSSNIIERTWWTIIFVLGMIGSTYMVYKLFDKWITTPVLVSLATREQNIANIPFPAVTVCPETKISRMCLNYTYALTKRRSGNVLDLEFEENRYFDYMSLLCRKENHEGTVSLMKKAVEKLQRDFHIAQKDFLTFPDFEEDQLDDYSKFLANCSAVTLNNSYCQWMGKSVNCDDVLTPIITDQGLCYSFNMYDLRDLYRETNTMQYFKEGNRHLDWNPDRGYETLDGVLDDVYPRRAFLNGAKHAFVAVFLTNRKDLNYACQDFAIQGMRVTLHTASKIPRPGQVFFSVGLDRLSTAAVKPILTETSKKIGAYNPERRNCYFGIERKLKYFQYYSQSNCNYECWTNYTIKKCGCVNFHMPRDNSTHVCSMLKRFCLEDARVSYNEDILRERLEIKNGTKAVAASCHCLPLCSDLTYNAEISTVDWDFKDPDEATLDFDREMFKDYHASAVKVYFKSSYFLPDQRDELYGITAMISNIGGALGLITGFSLVSVAEIIYVLSVKLIENYRKYGHWAGARND